jgi:hypothetical protein
MLMQIKIPHEPFNTAMRKGTAGETLRRILDEIKPEAVYLSEYEGQRGAVLIVDVAEPSKVPALAEPWFLSFNANVEFHLVMNLDDLGKAGIDAIGKKWG